MKNNRKKNSSIKGPYRKSIGTNARCAVFIICSLLTPGLSQCAFAHGNEKHVLGTVKSISDHSVTVRTIDGTTQEVQVTETTLFERSGRSATLQDLAVGDRVVIHAITKNGALQAHTVKIGSSAKGNP